MYGGERLLGVPRAVFDGVESRSFETPLEVTPSCLNCPQLAGVKALGF